MVMMYSVLHTPVTTTPDRGRVGTPQPTMKLPSKGLQAGSDVEGTCT
jgi:hypothetical protein